MILCALRLKQTITISHLKLYGSLIRYTGALRRYLKLTCESPCIMCVQYIGGCSVHRRDIMSTLGGYREYIRGCSVHRGDIMMNMGDTMSTSGDVQYIGGIP